MGCNISALKKMKEAASEDDNKKVLFLGLDNAGKSTILFQMKDNQFKETVPTVGLNVEQVKYRNMSFTLWDVSGQATRLWKHYFDKINAVIFVVDSSDRERLPKVKEELFRVVEDGELEAAPLLIYFNKQDLKGALPIDELKRELGIDKIGTPKSKDLCIQACSAKTGEGIWEGISSLGDCMNHSAKVVVNTN